MPSYLGRLEQKTMNKTKNLQSSLQCRKLTTSGEEGEENQLVMANRREKQDSPAANAPERPGFMKRD
ncbi:MAG: hypothetical protein RLO08_17040 [Parvibaculaceae bacterium]